MQNGSAKHLTHPETQKFTKRCSESHERAAVRLSGRIWSICITWRQLRQNLPHTAWQNMMWSSSRISLQQQRTGEHHITQTGSHLPVGYTEDVFAALDIQDELQTLYTSGTVFHTFLGEKLRTGVSGSSGQKKSQRIISCRIIQCLQHILSVRIMDTFPESSILVRSVEKKQRYSQQNYRLLSSGQELE